MEASDLSITCRSPDEPIAFLSGTGKTKTVQDFIGDVHGLASALPKGRDAINFCANRYNFLITFFALRINGGRNLLPPNRASESHIQFKQDYPHLFVVSDCAENVSPIETFEFPQKLNAGANQTQTLPALSPNQTCALSFTSGSTGKSKVIEKPWRTLIDGAAINATYFLDDPEESVHMLATVPAQHLWGFETSIMLPLVARVCVSDELPFYPADVKHALEKLPEPRVLVTTPTHLKAIVNSGAAFPKVKRILCATSPLDPNLAKQAEDLFQGDLIEIYGCTEIGSLAYRRTTLSDIWTGFESFQFSPGNDSSTVKAKHVEQSVELQDRLEFLSDNRFQLKGRSSDLINVGGKRGSITQINQIIQRIEGIQDSAVFIPESSQDKQQRPAAIVIADKNQVSQKQIRAALTKQLDPVFVPRPILFASGLPRNETGKLTQSALQALYQSLLKTDLCDS